MIYYIELEKHRTRFVMSLEASCETDARNKLGEAMLLYDVSPTKVIGIYEENPVQHSLDAG